MPVMPAFVFCVPGLFTPYGLVCSVLSFFCHWGLPCSALISTKLTFGPFYCCLHLGPTFLDSIEQVSSAVTRVGKTEHLDYRAIPLVLTVLEKKCQLDRPSPLSERYHKGLIRVDKTIQFSVLSDLGISRVPCHSI